MRLRTSWSLPVSVGVRVVMVSLVSVRGLVTAGVTVLVRVGVRVFLLVRMFMSLLTVISLTELLDPISCQKCPNVIVLSSSPGLALV